MGYEKINKRHARESMMKKRSWTHEGPSIQRKKKRERDSPCPKKRNEREMVHERSLNTIHI